MSLASSTTADAIKVKREEHGALNHANSASNNGDSANEDATANTDDNVDDEGVYEVEAIVGSRKRRGKQQYLIKWKGYAEEENTWEDVENVHAEDLLEEYWRKHNTAQSKKDNKLKRRRNDINNLARHDLDEWHEQQRKQQEQQQQQQEQQATKKSKNDDNNDGNNDETEKDGKLLSADNVQKNAASGIDFNVDWEKHVNKVETVERTDNKCLLVYLKWNNGQQTVHHASQVRERCPFKLLDFYEAHLRFTKIDVDAD